MFRYRWLPNCEVLFSKINNLYYFPIYFFKKISSDSADPVVFRDRSGAELLFIESALSERARKRQVRRRSTSLTSRLGWRAMYQA